MRDRIKTFFPSALSPENAKDYHRYWKKKSGEIWSSTGSLCFITRRRLSFQHGKPGHQRYLDERCLSGHRYAAAGWRKSERGYDPYAGRKKEAELATGLDQSFRENSTNGQSGHGRRFWRQVPDSAAFKEKCLKWAKDFGLTQKYRRAKTPRAFLLFRFSFFAA